MRRTEKRPGSRGSHNRNQFSSIYVWSISALLFQSPKPKALHSLRVREKVVLFENTGCASLEKGWWRQPGSLPLAIYRQSFRKFCTIIHTFLALQKVLKWLFTVLEYITKHILTANRPLEVAKAPKWCSVCLCCSTCYKITWIGCKG